jgi:hypothetical protein
MSINFNSRGRPPKGLFSQLLTLIGAVLALAAAFMFSLVFFAVLAIAGLCLGLYFWWTTRGLRRRLREQRADPMGARNFSAEPSGAVAGGEVIEGEAVRVVDPGRHPGDPG